LALSFLIQFLQCDFYFTFLIGFDGYRNLNSRKSPHLVGGMKMPFPKVIPRHSGTLLIFLIASLALIFAGILLAKRFLFILFEF